MEEFGGKIELGTKVKRGKVLFPRLDIDKELERLDKANQKLIDERSKKIGKQKR